MINGKAKLVKDSYCDGLGACIGECPTGALTIEEREADIYDEEAVKQRLHPHGSNAEQPIAAAGTFHQCPGTLVRFDQNKSKSSELNTPTGPKQTIPSELTHWPVQLHLVNPSSPFLENKELVLMSTCSPIASADVHWRFIRGRAVVVACPKLDNTSGYLEKMVQIIKQWQPPIVIVLRMEVPCCSGLTQLASQAIIKADAPKTVLKEAIVGINGDIQIFDS